MTTIRATAGCRMWTWPHCHRWKETRSWWNQPCGKSRGLRKGGGTTFNSRRRSWVLWSAGASGWRMRRRERQRAGRRGLSASPSHYPSWRRLPARGALLRTCPPSRMETRWGTRPWGTSRRRRDAGQAPPRPRVRIKTAGAPPHFLTATADRRPGKSPSRATRARGPRAPALRSRIRTTRSPRRLPAAPMRHRGPWILSSTRSRARGRPAPPPRLLGRIHSRIPPTWPPRATRRHPLPLGVQCAGAGSCLRSRARIPARRAWWRWCSLRPGGRGTRPPPSKRIVVVGRTKRRRKKPRRRRARVVRPRGGRRLGKRRRGDGACLAFAVSVSERALSLRGTALLFCVTYREYPLLSIVLISMLPSGHPCVCLCPECI